ncbi:MAG: MFS transporter [Alphaproteobacteria bacterium]|nr:MAG: MFS transporter [Alphaproteobacteria bacterium]
MLRVLIGFISLVISLSFLTSFVTIRFDISDIPSYWLGIVSGFYNIGLTLGSFKSSKLIKRLGFVKSYMGFASLIGMSALGLGFEFEPLLWMIFRFFIGYSLGALFSIIESFVMMQDAKSKSGSFATYAMCLYTGYGLSPYLFKVIEDDITSTFPLMLIGVMCFISMMIISLSDIDKLTGKTNGARLMFKDILQNAPLSLFYCFGAGFMNTVVYVFFPKVLFYQPLIHFTHLMAVSILGGALFQYPLRHLSRHFEKRTILFGINIFIACLIPLCVLFFKTLWLMLFLVMLGACLLAIYPTVVTYTCSRFEKAECFNIMQTLLLTYGIGSVIAPFIVTGVFMNLFMNNIAVFGAIFVMNALLLVFRLLKRVTE